MTERERLVENLANDRIFAFAAIERCFTVAALLDEVTLGRTHRGLKQKVAEECNKAWKSMNKEG